ncbi:Phosphoribosyl 1,2-cyclic phosphodiesterase [compost metagenome]
MKLQYLGTAAADGWPALFCKCEPCEAARRAGGKNIRTRSQSIIDDCLLVDMPPDTYYHALKYNLDLSAIGHILITHSHEDHFYPADMILKAEPYAHLGEAKSISVYGNKVIVDMLRQAMDGSGIEDIEDYINPVYVEPFVPFAIGPYTVTPLPAYHMPNEECYIYCIEKDGKRLLYGHDTGVFPQPTAEYIARTFFHLVSLDCTFCLRPWEHGHLGLPNNAEIRIQMLEQGSADQNTMFVINHFSHNGYTIHDELVPHAEKLGFITAFDGMIIEV